MEIQCCGTRTTADQREKLCTEGHMAWYDRDGVKILSDAEMHSDSAQRLQDIQWRLSRMFRALGWRTVAVWLILAFAVWRFWPGLSGGGEAHRAREYPSVCSPASFSPMPSYARWGSSAALGRTVRKLGLTAFRC